MDALVRLILDSREWQHGYDLATQQAADCPPAKLANPFGPSRDAFFGFEEGRIDAEKLKAASHGRPV